MVKRNLVIIGNWKMNKTIFETKKFFVEFKKIYAKESFKIIKGTRFGLAVPSISLSIVNANKVIPKMIIAAENIHQKEFGSYTGELSAAMVKAVGANAVIIGHSERRKHFKETDNDVNKKILVALKNKLIPIVCVGETLQERKNKKWKIIVSQQIKIALKNINNDEVSKIIIAYEPVWAIGTGVSASSKQAQNACKFVRSFIENETSKEVSSKIIIQYGGSVKPNNIVEFTNQKDIDGVLVGGASLDPTIFIKLLTLNK